MYEPKYKLNVADEARWRKLVTKEVMNAIKPEEQKELEKLCRKRYRKIRSHPKMLPVKQAERRSTRRVNQLFKKLAQLEAALKVHADVLRRSRGR